MKFILTLLLTFVSLSASSALTCANLNKDLSIGSKGQDVVSLQKFLTEKGFLKQKGSVDFDKATEDALKSYQKSKKLKETGKATFAVRKEIKSESCKITNSTNKVTFAKSESEGVQNSPSSMSNMSPKVVSATINKMNTNSLPKPQIMNSMNMATMTMPNMMPNMINGGMSSSTNLKEFEDLSSPKIYSLDKIMFFRKALTKTKLTVNGENLSRISNKFILNGPNNKEYILGEAESLSGTSTALSTDFTMKKFNCGNDCNDYLDEGEYLLSIKTSKGLSNSLPIKLRLISFSSSSGSLNSSVKQKVKGALLGQVSFSTGMSVKADKLKVAITGPLSNKVTNIKIKDELASKVITGNQTYDLGGVGVNEHASKIYSIYGDVDSMISGSINIDTVITIRDYYSNSEVEIKPDTMLVTISE